MSNSPIHIANKNQQPEELHPLGQGERQMVVLDVKGVWPSVWQLNCRITLCIYCQRLNDMVVVATFHDVGKEDFVNATCGKHLVVTS